MSMAPHLPSYKSLPSGEIELKGLVEHDEDVTLVDPHSQGRTSRTHGPRKFINPIRTRQNTRSASSRQRFKYFLLHFLPISLILALIAFIIFMSGYSDVLFTNVSGVCRPDGTYLLTFDTGYNPWTRDAVFAINLSFGSYRFATAKLIDIIWDVVSLIVKLACHILRDLRSATGSRQRRPGLGCSLHLHSLHRYIDTRDGVLKCFHKRFRSNYTSTQHSYWHLQDDKTFLADKQSSCEMVNVLYYPQLFICTGTSYLAKRYDRIHC